MPRYIGATNTAQIASGQNFAAGNQSKGSLYELLKSMGGTKGSAPAAFSLMDVFTQVKANNWSFDAAASAQSPTAGGTLTINSQTVSAGYDYTVHTGNVTVSSYNNSDFFTSTADSRVACIHVTGNLAINSGQSFIPGVRKPGAYIYVGGDLTINGEISMKARGANHSSSGSNLTSVDIRIIDGTHGSYSNPTIPATGGPGGPQTNSPGAVNQQATSPIQSIVNFGTGGGQHGIAFAERTVAVAGAGANGTCFTGGSGGGSVRGASYGGVGAGGAAQDRGGKGGNGSCNYYATNGSAGNPSGNNSSCQYSSTSGSNNGTGGVIVIFVRGTVSGSGVLDARGQLNWAQGSGAGRGQGQGSAGGMIAVFCDTYSGSGITLKCENGAYHDGGRYLSGDGTDDTVVNPSGYSTPVERGGTAGGFRKIQTTTLT